MKAKSIKAAIITIWLLSFGLASADYSQCILENMKGVGSDVAAEEIRKACEKEKEEENQKEFMRLQGKAYLVNFKKAADAAYEFSQTQSNKQESIKAVEMVLDAFSVDLPENQLDDEYTEFLLSLLRKLNSEWLVQEFPEAVRGDGSYSGFCAEEAIEAVNPGAKNCAHRPMTRKQFCSSGNASFWRGKWTNLRFGSLHGLTDIRDDQVADNSRQRLIEVSYRIELDRETGYKFVLTGDSKTTTGTAAFFCRRYSNAPMRAP
ncbi:MAG: hypothetical protein ACO2ZD_06365 [Pseudomonadales bacterium]